MAERFLNTNEFTLDELKGKQSTQIRKTVVFVVANTGLYHYHYHCFIIVIFIVIALLLLLCCCRCRCYCVVIVIVIVHNSLYLLATIFQYNCHLDVILKQTPANHEQELCCVQTNDNHNEIVSW